MLPATIDPTLNLCTRYPLRLGGPRRCVECEACSTALHMTIQLSAPTHMYSRIVTREGREPMTFHMEVGESDSLTLSATGE